MHFSNGAQDIFVAQTNTVCSDSAVYLCTSLMPMVVFHSIHTYILLIFHWLANGPVTIIGLTCSITANEQRDDCWIFIREAVDLNRTIRRRSF